MTATIDRRRMLAGAAALSGLSLLPAPLAAFQRSARVEALIAKMTIAEKAGQLSCFSDTVRPFNPNINPVVGNQDAEAMLARVRKGEVGCLFNGLGVAAARRIQDAAVKDTRLGIPIILAADVIHGMRTVYPIPLGEAASWNTDLAQRTARAAADEATAGGLHWTFAPMVDVARDQRWGRVAEGSGEDPYLGAELAKARVRGFQGRRLTDADAMLACPKHFVAYGAVEAGMDYNYTEISPGTLREIHLAPFKAAFEAGALSTMSSFNDVNGIPASGDKELLTGVLRDEWKFRGLVVSDYTSELELINHGYAADERDAARIAILAGVDMSMQSNLYNQFLPELVASGAVPMAVVDEAVRRVLGVKEALGLFDDPYRSMDARREKARIMAPDLKALSREAGRKAITLLKNQGDLLPLSASAGRYALIGPCADDDTLGAWAFYGDLKSRVSIEAGIRAALGKGASLNVVRGSDVEAPIASGIDAAVAAANAADIVILAVGESTNMTGEAQSVTDISIPAPQRALAEAVAATGKPVVVLLRHGRALALGGAVANAPAIMSCWFLGTEMGNAVADVLFGKHAPEGRLPVSFPNESGQQPFFYNHRRTGRPGDPTKDQEEYKARYRSTRNEARYAFGHGLGYTSFAIDRVSAPASMAWDGSIEVTARVTNTGKRAGVHVAQLYVHDKVASRTRPIRELKRFARVELAPGESKAVRFTLTRQDLLFWADDAWTVEPGQFDLWVCDHAQDERGKVSFTLSAA